MGSLFAFRVLFTASLGVEKTMLPPALGVWGGYLTASGSSLPPRIPEPGILRRQTGWFRPHPSPQSPWLIGHTGNSHRLGSLNLRHESA